MVFFCLVDHSQHCLLNMNKLACLRPKTFNVVRLASNKVPAPQDVTKKNAVFDQVTHTGQVSLVVVDLQYNVTI